MRFLIVLVLFVACAMPAAAATELCAAEPSSVVKVSDTVYGYVLAGLAPRTVTGHLGIYTGSTSGYLAPFASVELKRTEHQTYRPDGQPYLKYVDYESAPLYFTLPKADAAQDVWVDDVEFAGHAHARCQVSPYDLENPPTILGLKDAGAATPEQIRNGSLRNASLAFAREMPSAAGCAKRYVPPTMTQGPHVEYPDAMASSYNGPVNVVSKILLDKNGNIIDAWLFGASGFAPFDEPGLRAAEQAKYQPAQFLCKPVPSLYIFVQEFSM